MILNEFDAYQAALRKINLNEEVMPIYKGKVLTENVDTYCKIQKLLACNHLEGAHRWLYDLDIENLDESEINKVRNLYKLGVDKGYIQKDDEKEEVTDEADLMNDDAVIPVKDPAPVMPTVSKPEMPTAAYTIVYSAMRDGQIKTGEAYSNAINTRSAKADVISKLERAGYQNISILAIEAGDPDMVGCDNTYCKQSDYIAPQVDMSTANSVAPNTFALTITEDEAKAEVKKAFDEASAEVKNNVTPALVKTLLTDKADALEKLKEKLDLKTQKAFDQILTYLELYSSGKIVPEAEELDEGKKVSTGVLMIVKGLTKLLLTLVKLVGSTGDLSGKLISWISKLIVVGSDKLNAKLGEAKKLDEAGDEEDEDSKKDEDSKEDTEDDKSEDKEDSDEDKKEEDAEEPDEKLKDDAKEEDGKEDASDDKEEDELSNEEKNQLKDSYKKAFKATMQKCKYFDKCFDDLTLEEKIKFFETINDAWKNKADPSKFMSDKELETLEKVVVKK